MLCLTIAVREHIDIGEHMRLRFVGFVGDAAVVSLEDKRNGVQAQQTLALRVRTELRRVAGVHVIALRASIDEVRIGFDAPGVAIQRMRWLPRHLRERAWAAVAAKN